MLNIKVGDKITFEEEKQPYTVKAMGKRYIVCTKPFNLKKTVLYTVIDTKKNIRGTENLIFCMGAETTEQCQKMIGRLEHKSSGLKTEISYRNWVELKIKDICSNSSKKKKK